MERPAVLKQIWSVLRPGGYLFLNQTPNRFSPLESHTTGLPLINFLPDRFAHKAAVRFSRRTKPDTTWQTLLRQGIRGGTKNEVLELIRRACSGVPVLLNPTAASGDKDMIDLWYRTSAGSRMPVLKRSMWAMLKLMQMTTGAEFVPWLTLAIRKES
jgi:hypothetical protein